MSHYAYMLACYFLKPTQNFTVQVCAFKQLGICSQRNSWNQCTSLQHQYLQPQHHRAIDREPLIVNPKNESSFLTFCVTNVHFFCVVTCDQAYSSQDRTIDAFTSVNTASLIVFSAGNEGAKGFSSINKACKNCLIVGATQQSDALFRSMQPYVDPGWFCDPEFRINSSALLHPCCSSPLGVRGLDCIAPQCCDYPNVLNMSLACCGTPTNCNGGTCSVESGNMRSGNNVAEFSALGPSADGRFKPDLVAPGEDTLSAAAPTQLNFSVAYKQAAPDHCIVPGNQKSPRSLDDVFNRALKTLSGTSMSTPLMAGAAERIRQYFVQGYYPLGIAGSAPGFNPDAALLRAVIIASCEPLAGVGGIWKSSSGPNFPMNPRFYRLGIPPTFSPNFFEGFGLPILDHAVHMNTSSNGYNMIFVNGSFAATQSSSAAFNVACDPASSIRVSLVLVWNDPAGSVSSQKQLVNDLDLIVVTDDTQLFGNMRLFADQLNTVERVMLPSCPRSGNFTAVVTLGESLKTASQTWFLVSNGPITQVTPASALPIIKPGRALPPASSSSPCTFSPSIAVTLQFRQASASWKCVWSCNSEIATFTASLAQIVGVAVQGIRINTHNANGVSISLQCSSVINAWQGDNVSIKYVAPTSLLIAIQSICQSIGSICANDPALRVFDWASLAVVQSPVAKTFISVLSFIDSNCSVLSNTFGEAPNPFNFTDQACFPGRFITQPARTQIYFKAISCVQGNATFVAYTGDPSCSAESSSIMQSVAVNRCNQNTIIRCSNIVVPPSPVLPPDANDACKNGSLCLPISNAVFYVIIAVLAAHTAQFVAWAFVAKRRRCFTVSSALVLLLVPVLGLYIWRSVCCAKRDTDDTRRHLLNVLQYRVTSDFTGTLTSEQSAGTLKASLRLNSSTSLPSFERSRNE